MPNTIRGPEDIAAGPHGASLAGGLYMSLAMLGFVTNDTFMKIVTSELQAGQLILLRGLFATLIVLAISLSRGHAKDLHLALNPRVLVRASMDLLGTLLFITALVHMPLPDLTSILQSVPLAATLLAAVFLGETVRWRRITAIAVGFVGVLLIVRPGGEDFSIYTLFGLGAMMTTAVRDLITRRIPVAVPALVVATCNAAMVTIGGTGLALAEGLRPVSMEHLAFLAIAAAFLVGGYFFTVMALRASDIAVSAPFRYTIILWALLYGWLVFGDVPDHLTILGIALIVLSGLYTLYREQALRRPARARS